MLNRVILIGRVTFPPKTKTTTTGIVVTNFSIAVDRMGKGEKKTDFINITAFGKLAEICQQYLDKGKLVAIEGKLQVDSFEGKDGTKKKSYKVVADNMKMLGGKSSREEPEEEPEEMPF